MPPKWVMSGCMMSAVWSSNNSRYSCRVWIRLFFFSSRRLHTRWTGDWSSDVCSSDLTAERGDPDDRVGGGAARDLDGGAHGVIDLARARLVDEMHGSLDEAVEVEERLALVAEDVHERVADADDVDLVSHAPPSSCPAGSTCRSGDRADAASRAGTPR